MLKTIASKKMLDMEIKRVIRFDDNPPLCAYDNIATVANYYNIQYELMFIDSSDFNSKIKINNNKIEIIDKKTFKEFEILYKCCGITVKEKITNSYDEFIEAARNEITKGNPLMVEFDAYNCPWDPGYNAIHNHHVCILSGIDEENKDLYFTDPFFSQKNIPISIQDYSKAYSKCYIFEISRKEESNVNAILTEKIQWIKENIESKFVDFLYDAGNIFGNIDKYDQESIKNFYHQYKDLLLRESYCFTLFANIILYLKQSNNKYTIVISQFEQIFNHMMALHLLIQKGIVSGNMHKLFDKIMFRLKTIADIYSKIIEDIIKICRNENIEYIDNTITYKSKTIISDKNAFIDLSECFSNKSISDLSNPANLTGFGEYILKDSDLEKKYLENSNIKFLMPVITNDNFDNIICNAQKLEIEGTSIYHTISILGCAEFGNNQGKIKIIYQNGESDEINVAFPDFYIWDRRTPDIKEVIWTGKAAFADNDHSEEMYGTAHLYYNSFILKNNPIQNIILPVALNIHIFAITLSK